MTHTVHTHSDTYVHIDSYISSKDPTFCYQEYLSMCACVRACRCGVGACGVGVDVGVGVGV